MSTSPRPFTRWMLAAIACEILSGCAQRGGYEPRSGDVVFQTSTSSQSLAWIERGREGKFVVKRLRDADTALTDATLQRMRAVGEALAGKDYDLFFEWSDERIYCSELVWKIFERGAGIRLGELETIGDFDLSHPIIRAKLEERFGGRVPLEEVVVSPAAIYSAANLVTVHEN